MQLSDVGEGHGSEPFIALTAEQRAVLEVQLPLKRTEGKLMSIRLWGRVTGTVQDYIIACGLPADTQLPAKRFFFATTAELVLHPLPELSQEFLQLANRAAQQKAGDTLAALPEGAKQVVFPARFTGNPSTILEAGVEDSEEEEQDENGNPLPKVERFSELHWLAYTVQGIEHDTALVPRGAIAVTPTHHITENRLFAGLSASETANVASSLLHLRPPQSNQRSSSLGKAAALGTADFLDPISEDSPAGQVWAVRVLDNEAQVTARSLKWPGYVFFHDLNSSRYGGAYVGDGQANRDLSFMV